MARTLHDLMPGIAYNWQRRVAELDLKAKTKGYATQQEAFVQGAMVALLEADLIAAEDYQRIAFLCSVGRLDETLRAAAARCPATDRRAA